jgi:hypothetical protein
MLVDSDLGNHDKINNREIPIFDEFYLPEGFELFFSSSDGGMETLTNRLIRFCDRYSKQVLEWIIEQNDTDSLIIANGQPYTHFREWRPKGDIIHELNTDGLGGIKAERKSVRS